MVISFVVGKRRQSVVISFVVGKRRQSVVISFVVGIDLIGINRLPRFSNIIFMHVIPNMLSPSSFHHSIAQMGLLNIFGSVCWKTRFPLDEFEI